MTYKIRTMAAIIFISTMLFAMVSFADVDRINVDDITDIKGHWAEKQGIIPLIRMGIINGYPDLSFRPDETISRAEFIKLISKAMFDDIPTIEGEWYSKYEKISELNAIIENDEYTDWLKPITRDEMAKMIVRGLGQGPNYMPTVFEDDGDLNREKRPYIQTCVQLKIVKGYPNNTFRGSNTATRAEASSMIMGLLYYKSKGMKPNPNYNEEFALNTDDSLVKSLEPMNLTDKERGEIIDELMAIDAPQALNGTIINSRAEAAKIYATAVSDMTTWFSNYYGRDYKTLNRTSYRNILLRNFQLNTRYNDIYQHADKNLDLYIDDVMSHKISSQAMFVTSDELKYWAHGARSDKETRLRGRLFFKYDSHTDLSYILSDELNYNLSDIEIELGQWYQLDIEMNIVIPINYGSVDWEVADSGWLRWWEIGMIEKLVNK